MAVSVALGILAVLLGACLGLCCRRLVQSGVGQREPLPPLPALRGPDREELYRRRSAHLRAITLLREWLSTTQREQYERTQHFDVLGSASGRRYRIYHGTQFNIEELDVDGDAMPPSASCRKAGSRSATSCWRRRLRSRPMRWRRWSWQTGSDRSQNKPQA